MKPVILEAITLPESKRLIDLEKTIAAGQKTFVEVGTALAEIRDAKLYRSDYGTFEDYCREKWGWKKSYSYMLIEASSIVKSLPQKVSTIVDTESQARELAKVEPEKREEVLTKASESGKVTAQSIKEAAQEMSVPNKHEFCPQLKSPLRRTSRRTNFAAVRAAIGIDTVKVNLEAIERGRACLPASDRD
jgi:hypothetical protein